MNLSACVLASLGAATAFAGMAVLQQRATRRVAESSSMHLRMLFELARRPLWLLGGMLMLAGYGLQALALALGPVALVEPLVMAELVLAIPLGMVLDHRHPGRREWIGVACATGGITLFLVGSNPQAGISDPPLQTWIIVMVPTGGLLTALVLSAAGTAGRVRAFLLGAASGVCFGIVAVLTKATVHFLSAGVSVALRQWEPYVLIGVGIFALICAQSAFQAGPLAYSMPVQDLLEPAVAVLIGITALDERLPLTLPSVVQAAIGAGAACVGIFLLAQSPAVYGGRAGGRGHDSGRPGAGPTDRHEGGGDASPASSTRGRASQA